MKSESSCVLKRPRKSGSFQERILEEERENMEESFGSAATQHIRKQPFLTLSQALKPFSVFWRYAIPADTHKC